MAAKRSGGEQAATLEGAIAEATKSSRVCPMPSHWERLYQMLPSAHQPGGPPVPLILGAWHYASPDEKRARLQVHLEWAEKEGVLEEVLSALRGLTEDKWTHDQ